VASSSKYILSRLFIAVPELQISERLLRLLHRDGLVTNNDIKDAHNLIAKSKKYAGLASSMRGKTLVQRLMVVAPEIMSVATVDFLRRYDLIDVELGNALRIGFRAAKVFQPGRVTQATAMERWAALGQVVFSADMINLLRDIDNARFARLKDLALDREERAQINALIGVSIRRAQVLRSLLSTGKISAETLKAMKNANTAWDIITLFADGLLSDRMLKNAIRAGVISPEKYDLIRSLERLGLNVWKKVTKALEYDSFTARALLISEGVLSPELITALL
jgi:hypothetical protein